MSARNSIRNPFAWLPIAILLVTGPIAGNPLLAQSDVEESESSTTAKWTVVPFANDEHAAQFAKGLELLNQGESKKAASEFRRLKTKVKSDTERAGVERAFLEAQGTVELEKALGYAHKKNLRKALAHLEKHTPKYPETDIGEQMEEQREIVWGQLYFPIERFEPKESKGSDDSKEDDDGDADDADEEDDDEKDDDNGRGGRRRGGDDSERTGFGANTKLIAKSDNDKAVRHGEGALQWRTGANLSAISFDNLPSDLTEYRYLNISLRSATDARPQIVLLFDCLNGGVGNGGGRRRGGAAVFNREGYSTALAPSSKWQDLRLDLRKFTGKGEADWGNVQALRIVHMRGISAQLYIDEIRLEKK